MFTTPQNSYVEIPTPNVIALGGGAWGRCSECEGGALMNDIRALIEETPASSLSFHHV